MVEITKEREQAIVAKAVGMPLRAKKKLVASSLASPESDWVKVLLQGHTGTGKTRSLADILRTLNREGKPTKVFAASTDIGGNGLRSVKEDLLASGEASLLQNLAWFEFSTYEDFAAFTTNPNVIEFQGKPLWDWDPDVLALDGLSNFQESHVWRYVLGIESISDKPTEAREEGIQAGLVEWGQIRRSTVLQVDQFVTLHNPNGKKVHKVVTVLMDDGKEDKITRETKRGPLIMGGARSYIGPCFDYILTTVASKKPGTKLVGYSYRCDIGNDSTVAKARGVRLPEEALARADMKTIWESLTQPTKTT